MSFHTAGSLYTGVYPFVEKEIERLFGRHLIHPSTVPDAFRRSSGNLDSGGGNIPLIAAEITGRIRDIFSGNNQVNSEVIASNTAFWVQHLLKNPERKLRMFHPEVSQDGIIPVKANTRIPLPGAKVAALYQFADLAEKFPVLRKFLSHAKLDQLLWGKFILNLEALGGEYNKVRESIERGDKNILVVTNHLTWANIPFLAFCFHYFLGVPKEQLYALIGPAILTSEFEFEGARRWMNLILTWPSTPKGDTGYNGASQIQSRAVKTTLRIMKYTGEGVRVVFVAPSGTSDTMEEGVCKMSNPSEGTRSLIRRIGAQSIVLPIGVNDSGIMSSGGLPKKGNVEVKIGNPIHSRFADSFVMDILPGLVMNERGDAIGKWYTP